MRDFALSNELVDLIVDNLEKRPDFWICARVSHSFYSAACRHLYRSINIVISEQPEYSEYECKRLNTIAGNNPYFLSSVRRLGLDLSMSYFSNFGPKKYTEVITSEGGDAGKHHELTKFLLALTRASGLEELAFVSKWWRSHGPTVSQGLHGIGEHALLALVAIRCMPSLKSVEFNHLYYPPIGLVVGLPDRDRVTKMVVNLGQFHLAQSEQRWKPADLPKDGPLVTHFNEARADWEAIFRVHHQPDTFRGNVPLRRLANLQLDRVSPFYDYLEEIHALVAREVPANALLSGLRTLCYSTLPVNRDISTQVAELGRLLLSNCLLLHKLILEIGPDDGSSTHIVFQTLILLTF